MSQNGGSEALAWLVGIILIVIGVGVYIQVKAFAAWLNVDMDTAGSVLVRAGILLALLVGAFYQGMLLKTLPYLPCAFLIIMIPALDYWSWDHVFPDAAMNVKPAWYGVGWIQFMGAVLLGGMGYGIQEWIDQNR